MKSNDEIIAEITNAHDDGQPSRVISLWGDFQKECRENNRPMEDFLYVHGQVGIMLAAAIGTTT